MFSRAKRLGCFLLAAAWAVSAVGAAPIGTAFNYQGFLKDAGAPASGQYDFKFNLLDSEDPLTAAELASTTVLDVEVIDGLFMTSVDFGDVFDGSAVWLEIEVRPAGFGGLTTLYPPHSLHAMPYSVEASRLEGLAASDFVTTETDPTVPVHLKDGVDWSELQGIPTDFTDGVDNGARAC